MTQKYKLKNAVLMMALAAVYPMQSFAAAGVAQFTAGDVSLRRGAGSDPLLKGKDIESGDAIVTGPNGRAQVRFTDGGLVALQPNSQFNISNYADKNDGKQDSFFVDLLRGGMRAVTGLIGKRNHDNYKVTTTTATIGIRGSAFNLAYNPDGTLSVSTELDEIEVCTRAGCVGLKAGESALVVSAQEAPIRTSTRASLPTPEPRQDPIVVANQIAATPLPPGAPPPPAASPPPTAPPRVLAGLAFASSGLITPPVVQAPPPVQTPPGFQSPAVVLGDGDYVFNPARYDQRTYLDGTLYLDANGNPEIYLAATGGAAGQRTGTATIVSKTGTMAGGDYMLLGTWTANTWTADGTTSNVAPSAFVTGLPTLAAGLASLVSQRATYAFAAGTPVFSSSGDPGELLATSKLKVDFLAAGNYVDVSLDVRMPRLLEQGTAAISNDYNLRGSATGNGSGFGGNLSVSSADCINGSQCGTGIFNGFFSGNHAEKAGVSFVADTVTNGYIAGAATFAQGPLSAIPTLVSTSMQGAFMDGSGRYYRNTYLGSNYSPGTDEYTFNGDQLVKFKQVDTTPTMSIERVTAPGSFGAIGSVGDNDFIGWGNWVTASETTGAYSSYSSSSRMMDQLHYIVGKPTANMPNIGTGNYALIGGTAPTATYNGVSQLGQLVSGNLTVDFNYGSVAVNINTKFGTTAVNVSNTAYISGSTFRSCSGGPNINGIFTGELAYRAGLVYSTDVAIGHVTGAAAFQRTAGRPGFD
ncbi:hypothetical protein BH11PSE7_BH11PSE7_04350 [soil metagenome]